MHLQSPADLLLGLMQHFKKLNIQSVGVSSVLDLASNQHIRQLLQRLKVPVICAQVHAQYAGLSCGYDQPHQLGIDRWLQVLAVAQDPAKIIVSLAVALRTHH